jgi:hypothetical protein
MNVLFLEEHQNDILKSNPVDPSISESAKDLKKSSFRIYANRLFLTYSRTDLEPFEVLCQLKNKFSCIENYVISQENHEDEPEKGLSCAMEYFC